VSEWRYVAITVADRFLYKGVKAFRDQGVYSTGTKDDNDKDSSQEDEEEITTMAEVQVRQAGYGLRVVRTYYTVDRAFLSKLGPELLWEFQYISLAWHELLKLESTGGKPFQASHRRLASQELPSDGGKKSRLVVGSTRIKTEDEVRSQAEVGLRKVFGSTTVPRSSDQLDVLQLVLNPPKTSIIVMYTAGGKSVLFLVPAALADQKTIIVIVPYTALADDLFNNATLAGIDYKRWSRNYADRELHALVVVSTDITVNDNFLYYAQGLQLTGQLGLVVFDEGHVAFTDTSYRQKLREL
jgi:superfamily II DNA helicase RecQ